MRIQHNIPAMNAYRNYNSNTKALQANLQKLSSGYKINKAGDDAAGLAISEKMRAQITGLEVAQKNAKDGISLVQTAEGAMTEIHTMLNRMFSLAEQSANGTYDDEVDRVQLQSEFDKLRTEIDRIADATNFNGKKLLNGDLDGPTETAEKAATGVTPTLDQTNAAALKKVDVKLTATDDADKTKVADALEKAASFKITLNASTAAGAAIVATDKVTVSGLPTIEGAKMQYKDQTGAWADLTDGTDLVAGTGAGKIDVDTSNKLQLRVVGADETDTTDAAATLATMDVTFDEANVVAGAKDTTVTFAKETDFKAEKTTVTAPTTSTLVGVDPKFEIIATENKDIAALNEALDGKSLSITGTIADTGKTWASNDKIKIDGTAIQSLGQKGYTISYEDKNTTGATGTLPANGELTLKTTVTTTNPGEVKVGGANPIVLTIKDANGKGVATLTLDSPATTDTCASQTPADTISFANGTKTDELPEDEETYEGTALRLRVGDSIETYDDIKVGIRSMKADKLRDETVLADGTKGQTYGKTLKDLTIAKAQGEDGALGGADEAMSALKGMINYVSTERGKLGATQNRLDHTINNLSTMQENIQDAEATIRDVDVAEEMMKYTKNNILVQSAQAMLAQANQLPQGVLQLLG